MGQSLANRQHSNVSKKKAPPPASHKSASKAGPIGHKVVAKSVNLVKTPEPLVAPRTRVPERVHERRQA
jgi:hypothetical protein